ncbi:MAG TPA: hypothetical protein VE090_05415 [Methylomirabilota bacterium]|nr:hypothetical protein [Methylomirabilota bacterium]
MNEPNAEGKPPNELDSQNKLFEHLVGKHTLKGGPKEFPRSLDVGMFEPQIRGLRALYVQASLPDGTQVEGEAVRTIYLDQATEVIQHIEFSLPVRKRKF